MTDVLIAGIQHRVTGVDRLGVAFSGGMGCPSAVPLTSVAVPT
ncbi:hypothetical protein [Streptomyces acidicola]